jgi:ABC-2 type transport system ATP-binding protein
MNTQATSNTPAIHTTNLKKHYAETVAVEDLNLSIPRGTVYGFLGPNGAGKTSTIRMLTTLLNPTDGSAQIAGNSIENRQAVAPHIGYLPEEPPLYDELTAREQLAYVAGLRDLPDEVMTDRVESLLERFDLTNDANDRISTYSKGMKQKTGIIQALMHEPTVVFLDEPTSGLDPRAARTVRETIADLAADNSTVFLSTHILPVVEEIADRVGVLYDGSIVAEGAPSTLTDRVETGSESSLEDVFLDLTQERSAEPIAAEQGQ